MIYEVSERTVGRDERARLQGARGFEPVLHGDAHQQGELLSIWGEELTSEKDVWAVFYHHISQTPNERGLMESNHDDLLFKILLIT